jgi:hypothetical protein
MRVLLTGWFSFWHGEATAGDLLALEAIRQSLELAGFTYDIAWSPGFRPGALRLEDAAPEHYSHLVFVCGPLHGEQFTELHTRFAALRRIAVGVSVIDPAAPACAGFDLVLARDGGAAAPVRDLASLVRPATPPQVPVVGVALAAGQGEYGARRRHEEVTGRLTQWVGGQTCAPVVLETRLDTRDWRLCSTAEAFQALLARLDIVVTTRLHGLILALRAGIPALAVDPVDGGGKVTAQAAAWDWPACLTAAATAERGRLDALWDWCLSTAGQQEAADRAGQRPDRTALERLIADLERSRPGPEADRDARVANQAAPRPGRPLNRQDGWVAR